MRKPKILGLALAVGLFLPVQASNLPGPLEQVQVQGIGTVNYQHLFTEIGRRGESLDDFVVRLAPKLVDYSAASGFEACGMLATDGDRFGIVAGTSRSHVACVSFYRKVPEGMTATEESIHSHGRARFNPNANDRALQPSGIAGKGAFRGVAGQRVGGERLEEFSDMDFELPGYLAIPGGVLHQRGEGTVRTVRARDPE